MLAVTALCIVSCRERIDIHTNDSPPTIVIYGKLTTDYQRQSISITRSAGYFATSKPEGVSNADVWILTDDDSDSFQMFERNDSPGVYETIDERACIEGKTYRMEIKVDFDRDGAPETYTASSVLRPAVNVDTVTVGTTVISKDFLEVRVTAVLPEKVEGHTDYYSFRVYRNSVLLNDSLKDITVYDNGFLSSRYINDLPCYYLDQENEKTKLLPGDTITLQVDVLTKEYAEFLANAQSESRGTIPVFSGPPANVPSNIRCSDPSIVPFGFFTAYSSRRNYTVFE